jgi:hypothetical protein
MAFPDSLELHTGAENRPRVQRSHDLLVSRRSRLHLRSTVTPALPQRYPTQFLKGR